MLLVAEDEKEFNMLPFVLILLVTIAFTILMLIIKKNNRLQIRLKRSFKHAQEKYADDIASGNIMIEQQTEKHINTVLFGLFIATVIVIICEGYLFDAFGQVINSCQLLLGISPLYWLFLGFSLFFIFTLYFMLFVWWRDYKRIIKTGYGFCRESSIFVKVFKKQNLTTAKFKFMGSILLVLFFSVLILNSANDFVVYKTNQTFATYQLIKTESQAMKQNCLAKKVKKLNQ